jgi:hypothetical protein
MECSEQTERKNLISAVEIAAAKRDGLPVVPEVTIFFENTCTGATVPPSTTPSTSTLSVRQLPLLAEAGITIKYNFLSYTIPMQFFDGGALQHGSS